MHFSYFKVNTFKLICFIIFLIIAIFFALLNVSYSSFKNNNISTATSTTNIINSSTSTSTLYSSNYLKLYSDATSNIACKVLPSVVGIEVEYTITSNYNKQSSLKKIATGSGVIISDDGYILTNNHVIENNEKTSFYSISLASSINVYLYNDNTPYKGTIVGNDSLSDLAVIKIEKNNLPCILIGNSDDVKIASFAMAIGNPLGLTSSVTTGCISAVNRDISDSNNVAYSLIQTDCAINSGNSGGALVNSLGELIGINTLKLYGEGVEGIGFAIPINEAKKIADELITNNKITRPYLGIECIEIDDNLFSLYNYPKGLYIISIAKDSPAETSGLKIGDIILEVDNIKVLTNKDLSNIIYNHNVNDKISIKLFSNNTEITKSVLLKEI